LIARTSNNAGKVAGFLSYQDYYRLNYYAFFSSYKVQNGYNPYSTGDCATLGVSPYQSQTNVYYKPNGIQIICAGADGTFGAGGLWIASNAPAYYPAGSAGFDDLANFYDSPLGVPQ
jgi:hypothetical protein